MCELTFLTEEQFYLLDDDGIFDEHGEIAKITDFVSLLGCYQPGDGIGEWWTKTTYRDINDDDECDDDVRIINEDGMEDFDSPWSRFTGARPAFSISSIISKQRKKELEDSGVKEFEYGEYPQTIVDEEYSKELEKLYSSNGLIITGRNYTTDSAKATDGVSPFKAKIHIEYEYNGRQYIRFVYDDLSLYYFNLSDGRKLERGKIYWVAVEPIVWLLDLKADIALSKKVIFSGVQFESSSYYEIYKKTDFERSTIKKFMDKCLSKEIVADRTYPKVTFESQTQENIESKKLAEKQISDAINFVGNSEEDTESRELVENQTSNEFNFVDNLEESTENKELVEEQVSNTSNFDDVSREDVDSEESVANKISDDFDFANVPEENIENKEPDETQIFGAINFDNNSEEETETKIHPYVYAYIMYKSYSGYDVLSNRLNYWKMVSELLYKTKKLEILPDTLKKLIGDELSKDFIAFISQQVISKEDVLSYNYSSEDLKMSASQFFATLAELLFVDVKYIETVRCFEEKIKLDTSGMKSGTVFEFENWTEFSKRFEANEKLKEIKNCCVEKSVEQVSDVVNFDNNSMENTESKVTIDSDFDRDPEENAENKELAEKQISDAINFDNNSEKNTESKESVANKTSDDFNCDSEEEVETKIHPYVSAYMAYKAYNENKLNVDSKKWQMASKVLFETKELLSELLGDDIAKDFIAFTRQQVISLEDVINHNYSSKDLEMSVFQKFATAAELSLVDDEHLEKVKDFMKQVDGSIKMKTVFENLSDLEKKFEKNEKSREIKPYQEKKSVEQVSNTSNFDDVSRDGVDNKEVVKNRNSNNFNYSNVSKEETETKIHPYVYTYILYKSYSGYDVLSNRLKYWENVSELLYKTNQSEILPDMLRKLLGDELAEDFIAFTNQQVISLEDVINHNYSSEDLEMSVSQKFATVAELCSADNEYFEVVRDFMNQADAEMGAVFESWTDLKGRFETSCRNEENKEIPERKAKVRRKKKN